MCTDIYTMQGSCFPSSLPLILLAASEGQYSVLSWAIDHGGADMTTVSGDGRTVWDHLLLPTHPDSDIKNPALRLPLNGERYASIVRGSLSS